MGRGKVLPPWPKVAFRPQGDRGRGRRKKPNILVIMADDLGWADLSCHGAPHINTPHLDRLAREGLRFTHAYAGSSTCSPTRVSLYTGRYPGRLVAGLSEPIRDTNDEQGIPPTHPTLASLLSVAGTGPDAAYPMDGRDLSDHLGGDGASPGGDLFWRVIDAGALRRGKWKYWYNNDQTGAVIQEKLFDLDADQREKADLSRKHPELVAALREAWKATADTLLPYPPGATPYGGW